MGGLREGLSQAQWLRPNWLGMETAGNVQNAVILRVFFFVFETFPIMSKAMSLWHVCNVFVPGLKLHVSYVCACLTPD